MANIEEDYDTVAIIDVSTSNSFQFDEGSTPFPQTFQIGHFFCISFYSDPELVRENPTAIQIEVSIA